LLMHDHKRGFTLVELLVVISIIALLLAIMVPALNMVRGRTQTIICGTNLKNYGPALCMYAQENSDKAPFSFSWLYSMKTIFKPVPRFGIIPQGCRWHYDVDPPDGSLWPYLKNINVHMCPTFRGIAMADKKCYNTGEGQVLPGMPPDRGHDPKLPFNPVYSYSMNRWLGLDWPSYLADPTLVTEPSLKLTMVKRPAQCFAFSEENMWTIGNPDDRDSHPKRTCDDNKIYSSMAIGKNDLWLSALKTWPDGALSNFATYHNVSKSHRDEGFANALYVDGHVKTVKGRAGYDAYLEYGRPYIGHERQNIW